MESDDELVTPLDPHVPTLEQIGAISELGDPGLEANGEPRPLTTGQFNSACTALGLSHADLARMLEVQDRTARAWFSGKEEIPPWLSALVRDWREETSYLATALAEKLEADNSTCEVEGEPEGVLEVFRTNHEFWKAYPELRPWPARWWKIVAVQASMYAGLPRYNEDDEEQER